VSLVVKTGPSCIDTLTYPALIDLDPIPFIKNIPDLSGCLGSTFSMADLGPAKEHYTWSISYNGHKYDSISNSSTASFVPEEIGNIVLKVKYSYGSCEKEMLLD